MAVKLKRFLLKSISSASLMLKVFAIKVLCDKVFWLLVCLKQCDENEEELHTRQTLAQALTLAE